MRGRRALFILIGLFGVLVLVVVAAFALFNSVDSGNNNGNNQPPPAGSTPGAEVEGTPTIPLPTVDPAAQLVEVVVSLQTVPRGWQMTEAELTTDLRLASEVGTNVITRIEDAIGLYARTDIFQGETITTDSLVRDPTLIGEINYGPSSLIPPGWVAMAIPMDRLSGVAYGLTAGDAIDIMLSFQFRQIDEEFQTYLLNSATSILEIVDEEGNVTRTVVVVDPFGRIEQLPNNDLAHVSPGEDEQRPIPVSMIVQNARVIQVGAWTPPPPAQTPTPTVDPNAPTETPSAGQIPTSTPQPPNVILVALPPQQQLLLKYAVEAHANIDLALRGVNDGQLYNVQPVDLTYLLTQFNFGDVTNVDYTIEIPATGTPIPNPAGENNGEVVPPPSE
jgi:Flp pilus assembly protein CpaB